MKKAHALTILVAVITNYARAMDSEYNFFLNLLLLSSLFGQFISKQIIINIV